MIDVQEYVVYKLNNPELYKIVEEYQEKRNKQRELSNKYIQLVSDEQGVTVQAKYKREWNTFTDSFMGITNPIDETGVVTYKSEYLNKSVNNSYQPLKKTAFNKELTNNFEDTVLSFVPLIEVTFGDPNPRVFFTTEDNQHGYRLKPLKTTHNQTDKTFIVEIEKRDVNEHVLKNFVEYTE